MHRHSERVFTIPEFLSPAECDELIGLAEANGFEAASVRTQTGPQLMTTVRNNQRVMFSSPQWKDRLWNRLSLADLPLLDGNAHAVGLPADLRFYKYSTGERFKMHKDGPWKEGGLTSKLSFLCLFERRIYRRAGPTSEISLYGLVRAWPYSSFTTLGTRGRK